MYDLLCIFDLGTKSRCSFTSVGCINRGGGTATRLPVAQERIVIMHACRLAGFVDYSANVEHNLTVASRVLTIDGMDNSAVHPKEVIGVIGVTSKILQGA